MVIRSSWAGQNSGPAGTIDVEEARLAIASLAYPHTSILKGKSGFRPGPGASPGLVTATGTPDGFVHVAPFQLLLQGVRAAAPGMYLACADAIVDINILSTPADPTNPRNDLVIAQQSDTFYGDGNSDFQVKQVVGTPAGSPADPAITGSADHIVLARVRVDANATTIVAAKITDLRTTGHAKSLTGGLHAVALGGILPVATSAERDALTGLYAGLKVWRTDIKTDQTYDGTAWVGDWTSYSPSWTAAGANPVLGNGTLTGEYKVIGRDVQVRGRLQPGSTTTFGSGEYYISAPFTATSVNNVVGPAFFNDAAVSYNAGVCVMQATATKFNFVYASSQVAPTIPFTWGNGDQLIWQIEYPII